MIYKFINFLEPICANCIFVWVNSCHFPIYLFCSLKRKEILCILLKCNPHDISLVWSFI